jgi:hypothetical protein
MLNGSLSSQVRRMPNLVFTSKALQWPNLHNRCCPASERSALHGRIMRPSFEGPVGRRARVLTNAGPSQAMDFQGPDALLFDCDGVLVDTEAEGHRIAFNKAFKEKGEHFFDTLYLAFKIAYFPLHTAEIDHDGRI